MSSTSVDKSAITIAIDWFAGTGKGVTAKGVADTLCYLYIDTGAMYRATTLYFLDNEIAYTDPDTILPTLEKVSISFLYIPQKKQYETYVNGKNVEEEIRTMRVTEHVARVADIPAVRTWLVKQQQEMGKWGGVVMDGRDIGSVVFPNAELKVFLTTDLLIRAQRRQAQLAEKGEHVTIETIVKNMQHRDSLDAQRTDILFEKFKKELKTIDTTWLEINDQINQVVRRAKDILQQINNKS